MLVDRSSRVWAMRRDDVVSAHAIQLRAEHFNPETPRALVGGDWLEGSDFARIVDGVAIIPVYGPLMRTFSFWAWSYEEVARDLKLAEASPLVQSIVLDIDSPGGLAAGCGDCAALIRSIEKPVTAFVGGLAASAAYWLASACDRILVGSGSILGSIGAVIEYVDIEPMFEKMGARIIRVVAEQSPNKRLDPESADGQAELQALVDASGAEFVAGVAAGRGVEEAAVLAGFGQGLVFDGTEAVRRGLADDKGTLDLIVADLAARDIPPPAVPAPAAQEKPMDWDTVTLAALREHRPELVSEIEGAASTLAATAERDRILGIEEIDAGGHDDLITAAKKDGKTTPEALALKIMKAEKTSGAALLATREAADANAALAALPPRQQTTTSTGTIEDRAKADWDKDAGVRAEFGDDFPSYLAFRKADAEGRARILRRAS